MGNLIKGLLKTSKIKSVCFPYCIFLDSSSIKMISCVLQDLFSRNPCFYFCQYSGMPLDYQQLSARLENKRKTKKMSQNRRDKERK